MPMPPDIVLPAQFYSRAGASPERRLMIAVLADAVQTWEKSADRCARCDRPPTDEVDAWFASDDISWPFAFLSICHHLGFEPNYIRSGIAQLRRPAEKDCVCMSTVPHDSSPAGQSLEDASPTFFDDVHVRTAIADDGRVG